jgi:hypothetical protein
VDECKPLWLANASAVPTLPDLTRGAAGQGQGQQYGGARVPRSSAGHGNIASSQQRRHRLAAELSPPAPHTNMNAAVDPYHDTAYRRGAGAASPSAQRGQPVDAYSAGSAGAGYGEGGGIQYGHIGAIPEGMGGGMGEGDGPMPPMGMGMTSPRAGAYTRPLLSST